MQWCRLSKFDIYTKSGEEAQVRLAASLGIGR